jgi:hypothetical protein
MLSITAMRVLLLESAGMHTVSLAPDHPERNHEGGPSVHN